MVFENWYKQLQIKVKTKRKFFYPRPLNMQENKLILVQYQQNKTT